MWIVIGLGNPGSQYAGTKHNVGFEVIDKMAYDHGIKVTKIKHRALIGEGSLQGEKIILAKPQTYMNLSGESIREIMSWYKVTNKDIIIVYDDVSLPIGELRIRERGSAGGHNGIKNIIYQLGTEAFTRIKIGVGEKPPGWSLADYVLSRFGKEELSCIVQGITDASEAAEIIIKMGVADAMNRYNQRKKG